MIGKLVNGQLVRPPSQGVVDGKTVSNYNMLPAEKLQADGWKPIDINTPDYNEETEILIPVYTEQENKIVINYNVEPMPEPELDIKDWQIMQDEDLEAIIELLEGE